MTRGDGGEQALAARRVTMGGGREQVKHREKKKNGSTKLSSILTVQNSKLHIEILILAKIKVIEEEKIYNFDIGHNLI